MRKIPPAVSDAAAVLPGGARFVSGSHDRTAKLWSLDGALERTFAMGIDVICVAAVPDGAHFVVGLGIGPSYGEVRLYHVDGTLVHTFKGHADWVCAAAVTPDGLHIISGSDDMTVKVWSVASKSPPTRRTLGRRRELSRRCGHAVSAK